MFTNSEAYIILVGDADKGKRYACAGAEFIQYFSDLFQFYCESKTAVKKKQSLMIKVPL